MVAPPGGVWGEESTYVYHMYVHTYKTRKTTKLHQVTGYQVGGAARLVINVSYVSILEKKEKKKFQKGGRGANRLSFFFTIFFFYFFFCLNLLN